MSICMRTVQKIECPTCGYSLPEALYALEEINYDPGCPYEADDVEAPDLGELELEDGYDDLSEFQELYDDMADEMLQQSYFGG